MVKIKKSKIASITLDVLKPHKPDIIDFGKELKGLKTVKEVHIIVRDLDKKTEKVTVFIDGNDLDITDINNKIENFGAVIHSVDEVIVN